MLRPLLVAALLATPAAAQDAAKGEAEFRKCKSCHMIEAPDGTAIVKGGKTGPNLYGVIGRPVASTDFAYGDSLKAVGASGKVWDEASLAAYVQNPTEWLKTATGDAAAKSKMTFKLAKGGADVAAYLASVAR
jgi:cytochrome c